MCMYQIFQDARVPEAMVVRVRRVVTCLLIGQDPESQQVVGLFEKLTQDGGLSITT